MKITYPSIRKDDALAHYNKLGSGEKSILRIAHMARNGIKSMFSHKATKRYKQPSVRKAKLSNFKAKVTKPRFKK